MMVHMAVKMHPCIPRAILLLQAGNMRARAVLVAPLLQRVAADVSDFVKSGRYNRMPTRSEMHREGELCECMHIFLSHQHQPSPDASCMLPLPLLLPWLFSEF